MMKSANSEAWIRQGWYSSEDVYFSLFEGSKHLIWNRCRTFLAHYWPSTARLIFPKKGNFTMLQMPISRTISFTSRYREDDFNLQIENYFQFVHNAFTPNVDAMKDSLIWSIMIIKKRMPALQLSLFAPTDWPRRGLGTRQVNNQNCY